MIKVPVLTTSFIILSAFFFLAGYSFASEDYDEDTYGPEKPIEWNKPIKATFNHKVHTMEAGLDCESCHDDIFEMEAGAVEGNEAFTMKAMADGQSCGSCHDGDTAFATDENCAACHSFSEETIVWNEPTKAAFSHTAHVEEYGLECESCHSKTFTMKKGAAAAGKNFTMGSFKKGQYCGSCHNGDDAFDSATQCESCHFPPSEKIVFTQPVKAVVFDHAIHVEKEKLSCESCHKEVFAMKRGTVEEQPGILSDDPAKKREYLVSLHKKYCGTCHDASQAFGYLTRCTVCHVGVKGLAELNGDDKTKDAHGKETHK
ncbi:MAG: hypothetical protein JRC87_04795 [Deltaproteobacteria bacterium]|nr:hypothetical protein [Deltaproteobacteria bacterium]MBW2658906.1 hypothetical protein [Deltaproteobacteria bacterium]